MITEKIIISGTEEELLEYFKNKYNLVEACNKTEVTTASHTYATLPTAIPPYGAGDDFVDEELPTKTPIKIW